MTEAKELREAIEQLHRSFPEREYSGWGQAVVTCRAAAEKYLATLPREVEIEGWAVVRNDGSVETVMRFKDNADGYAEACEPRTQVVRLTGTATLPGRK